MQLSLLGRKEDALNDLAKQCRLRGADVFVYCLDLLKTEELIPLIEDIDTKKAVDLVIANAGVAIYLNAQFNEEPWPEVKKIIDTNLTAAMATVSPLISRMRQRKQGQIAFMSSLAAFHGMAINPSYSASKAGLKAYGEALRALLKTDGIQVSVICPGFIESQMSQQFPGARPFLISAEAAANKIKKGLCHNKAYIIFPNLLALGMRLLTRLPSFISGMILQKIGYGVVK